MTANINLKIIDDKKERKIIRTLVKTFNGRILNLNERKLYGVDKIFNI